MYEIDRNDCLELATPLAIRFKIAYDTFYKFIDTHICWEFASKVPWIPVIIEDRHKLHKLTYAGELPNSYLLTPNS